MSVPYNMSVPYMERSLCACFLFETFNECSLYECVPYMSPSTSSPEVCHEPLALTFCSQAQC